MLITAGATGDLARIKPLVALRHIFNNQSIAPNFQPIVNNVVQVVEILQPVDKHFLVALVRTLEHDALVADAREDDVDFDRVRNAGV